MILVIIPNFLMKKKNRNSFHSQVGIHSFNQTKRTNDFSGNSNSYDDEKKNRNSFHSQVGIHSFNHTKRTNDFSDNSNSYDD